VIESEKQDENATLLPLYMDMSLHKLYQEDYQPHIKLYPSIKQNYTSVYQPHISLDSGSKNRYLSIDLENCCSMSILQTCLSLITFFLRS
jgi:hypothetical protein